MPHHRRPRSLRSAALIVGGLTALAVAVPFAADGATGRAAAAPAASADRCAFSTAVGVKAFSPVKTGRGSVTFRGVAFANADTCGYDMVRIVGQRMVCGFWGCNPREVTETDWKQLGAGQTTLQVSGACESGKYRYRTLVQHRHNSPGFAPGASGGVADVQESGEIAC